MSNINNILEMSYATQGNKTTLFTEEYISETLNETKTLSANFEKLEGVKSKIKVFTVSFDIFQLTFKRGAIESLNEINSLLNNSRIKEVVRLSSYTETSKNLDVLHHGFKNSTGVEVGRIQYNSKLKIFSLRLTLLEVNSAEQLKIIEHIIECLKLLIMDSDLFEIEYDNIESFLTVNGVYGHDWSNPNGTYSVKPIVNRNFVIYKSGNRSLLLPFYLFGDSIRNMY